MITAFSKLRTLHRDESGVISLLTVFVMLGCAWMLLWVVNSARQLDTKVRLQVAADSAGQSGAGILVRGMNAVAFANQLEAELFAAVAVMEAAEQTSAASSPLLVLRPVFESVLSGNGAPYRDRPIPVFRSDLVRRIPPLAEELTRSVGRMNGLWRGPDSATNPDGPQGPLLAQLWTTSGRPVSHTDENDPRVRTLPVLDPCPQGSDAQYLGDTTIVLEQARRERVLLASGYLRPWAIDLAAGDLVLADQLVERATRSLRRLLQGQYPDTNLPMLLRTPAPNSGTLQADLMFVAVTARRQIRPTAPLMFTNPNALHSPAMAFAQVHLFLPRDRYTCCPWTEVRVDPQTGAESTIVHTEGWPSEWSASTQNWQAKLVPVTAPGLGQILASSPSPDGSPSWGSLSPRQLDELVHQ